MMIRSAGRCKKHHPDRTSSQDCLRSPAKTEPTASTLSRKASTQRLKEVAQVPIQMSPRARRFPASKSSASSSNSNNDHSKIMAAPPSTRT